jgi:hypothetical protein
MEDASVSSSGSREAVSRRNRPGRADPVSTSQPSIGVSFDDSLARKLGAWNSSPEAPAPRSLHETDESLLARGDREATIMIEKAEILIEPAMHVQMGAAENHDTDQSAVALIEQTENDLGIEEEPGETVEIKEVALAQLSRVLISDLREASRAAQTAWLREGTSAMVPLARNAAISSDTVFKDDIRKLYAHLCTGPSSETRSTRAVWFVSKSAVPIKPVLALAFAEACVADGKKVLIVDGDVRTPGLTRLLVANGQLGAEARRGERGRIIKTEDSRFDVLIMSTPNEDAIASAIDDARNDYDLVVVDARVDALSPDLRDDNDTLYVSSNRANEPADIDTSLDDLAASLPWLRGFILTAKGISTSAAAIAAHAPSA